MSRRRSLLPLIAAVALAGGALPVAAQDDAPPCAAPTGPSEIPAVPGGGEALTGTQPGPAPVGTPILCWTAPSGNAAFGTRALAAGDRIVTLSDTGDAVAFAQDGSEAWRVNLATTGEGLLGGLATDGTHVFVGTPTGLVALAAADGATAWTYAIDPGPQTASAGIYSPVVVGDRVLALSYTSRDRRSMDRAIVAVDRAAGTEQWSQPVFADIPAGPLTADDTSVAVAEGDGSIVLRATATGEETLRIPIEDLGAIAATPVALTRDDLIVGLNDGLVLARYRDDGEERWTYQTEDRRTAAITVNGPFVFVNSYLSLISLDATSGEERWVAPIQQAPPPFAYQPIPAIVDGLVILGTTDINAAMSLVALDAQSGTETWRVETDVYGAMFSPVVTSGYIYAPSLALVGTGGVLAFGAPA